MRSPEGDRLWHLGCAGSIPAGELLSHPKTNPSVRGSLVPGVSSARTCALCHCREEASSTSSPSRHRCFGSSKGCGRLVANGLEVKLCLPTPHPGASIRKHPRPPSGCGVPRAGLMDGRKGILCSQLSRNKITARKISSQSVPFGARRVPLQPSGSGFASHLCLLSVLGMEGLDPVPHC